MFESFAIFVSILICSPAVLLAMRRSTWLIDYLFFVVAFNRGIRRMVDFSNGYFNPFSPISLTPIIVCGLAVVVVLLELNDPNHRFGRRTAKTLYLYAGVVTLAFLVGFLNAKLGAIYALGDFIAPIGLIGYGAVYASDAKTIDRWCQTFAISVLGVAVYGVWQFYTIPPWDAFWLVSVKMTGYMGLPEPTKMTLFSTMAERGPAAVYLCSGLILLSLRSRTLGILRWPSAAIIAFAMLLTYSRTTVIFAGLAIALYPVLNRGAGVIPVLALAFLALFAGPSLMSQMPGQASSRVETIGAISEDGSFQGRILLLGYAFANSLSQPLGLGIGAGGMAERIQKATVSRVSDSSGYMETLATYGWVGFFVIINVLYRLWRASSDLLAANLADRNILIFRAWFVAGMAALFSGNWLAGASFFWVLAGCCLGLADHADADAETEEDLFDEDVDAENWEDRRVAIDR